MRVLLIYEVVLLFNDLLFLLYFSLLDLDGFVLFVEGYPEIIDGLLHDCLVFLQLFDLSVLFLLLPLVHAGGGSTDGVR